MNKRLLSMFLALCMIVTMLPVSAMAEEIHTTIGGSGEIISFAPLTETAKAVSLGTSIEDLELPETLTATVRTAVPADEDSTQDSGSPETATPTTAAEPKWKETTGDIPVEWASPDYDMDTEGAYVFTPVIADYTVSAPLPELTVTVDETLPIAAAQGMASPLPATTYNIWVGGVQVTDANKDDVLDAANYEGATITYDPDTSTLTLDNATINAAHNGTWIDSATTAYYGIYAETALKIEMVGSNTVIGKNQSGSASIGIYTGGTLNLSGSGSLYVSGGTGKFSVGIYSTGSIAIEGGRVTATSVAATQTSMAIASNGDITISNEGVEASAGTSAPNSYGMIATNGFAINNGEVTASGKTGLHTNAAEGPVTVSDGRLTANGSLVGIAGALTVTGGTVTVKSDTKALDGSLATSGYTGCTVTAGANKNGDGAGTYNASSLASYKYIKVEPAATPPVILIADHTALQSAIDGATGNLNLKLSDSYSGTGTITIPEAFGYNITIDLNGKTLDGGSSPAIQHQGTGTLTIIDSSSGGTVTSSTSSHGTIAAVGGSVELLDGTVSNSNSSSGAAIYTKNATLNIRGGAVSATGDGGVSVWDDSSSSLNIYGGTLSAAGSDGNAVYSTNVSSRLNISGGTISAVSSIAIYHPNTTIQCGTTAIIQGGSSAMQSAPKLSGVQGMASINYSGSDPAPYDSVNLATYKYLKFEPAAGVFEQFNLTPGGTYYFDLSGEIGNIGTVNAALPDTTLHYVPFTYVGTVNAYSLTSAMATTEEYAAANKSDRSLFVGDFVIDKAIRWNTLDTANLIFGKTFDTNYKLRSLSAGSSKTGSASDGSDHIGRPSTNEWDQILTKSGSTDDTTGWIKNWSPVHSYAQDTIGTDAGCRTVRGYNSARHWGNLQASDLAAHVGFRPALEVLNPAALTSDGLKAVTLKLNGGKLKESTADINIICADDSFKVPSGEGLTAPSGKTFAGWKDSGGTTYAAGATVPNTVTGLTALWAEPSVAQIGSTGYATLQAAVDAVTSGQTIKLMADITLSTAVTIASSNAYNFTLDLNGKKLTFNFNYYIKHDGSGTLTITDNSDEKNGKISALSGTIVVQSGNLIIAGGTVECTSASNATIYLSGTGSVSVSGGLVTGNRIAITNQSAGTVVISGGTVKSTGSGMAIYNDSTGSVTISGGTVESTDSSGAAVYNKPAGIITVSSGSPVIRGGGQAMNKAPTLGTGMQVTASTDYSGSPTTPYIAGNISSYKYLAFAESAPGAAVYPVSVLINISHNHIHADSTQIKGVNPGNQTIEYAISTDNSTAPTSGWQAGGAFIGLLPSTTYYVWARTAAKAGYNAGTAVASAGITTTAPPVNASISPTSVTYDLNPKVNGHDGFDITLTSETHTLTAVKNGETTLTKGLNYTADESLYTILYPYLRTLPIGTTTITFDMDGGTDPTLALTIEDTRTELTSVTIGNTAPKFGDTLSAAIVPNAAAVSYIWKANGLQVGTGATYEVKAADIGKIITLTVTGNENNGYKGTVTSSATSAVAAKDYSVTVDSTKSVVQGSGLSALPTANAGAVNGTLTWYSDSGLTKAVTDQNVRALVVDSVVTVYWSFTPTTAGYVTTPKTGECAVTIVSGEAQTLSFAESAVTKTVGDPIFTNALTHSVGTGMVIYSSSNTSVASVHPTTGEVAIVGAGTTTITANAAMVPGVYAPGSASFTLTVNNAPIKTVSVGSQSGTATAGTAGSLTYAVTTANITNGIYAVSVANLPTGVTIGNGGNVTISGNSGTLTLTVADTVEAGTTGTLALTLDGATSAAFSIVIGETTPNLSATDVTLDAVTVGYMSSNYKSVVITNSGDAQATISNVTTDRPSVFSIHSGQSFVAANGSINSWQIRAATGLAVGIHTATITVTYDGGRTATATVSITVNAVGNYTVTFNPNGGTVGETTRSVASGTAVGTLPTPTRSGSYSFDGWYTAASGGTQISASTTVSANVTYYAHWTYTGSGGSGSGGGSSSNDNSSPVTVTPPAPDKPNSPTQGEIKVSGTVDSKGNVTVNISDKTVTDAFEKALADAKKNGNEQNGITVILRVDTGSKTGSNVTVNLPKTVQDTIIAKKIVNTIVVVDNPDIRIGMNLATVQEINKQAKSDVNITATRGDSSKLTGDAKKAIGSRPVFDLKVNYGNGKEVSSFGTGSVSVTIPYTLGANEKAGNVQAVYVDAKGKVHWLTNSVYDSVAQVLRFSTDHFSTYAIGYKQTNTAFTDIAAHWAKEDIEFVVSRGLFSGTSNTTFSPNTAMTRGMFVTALGRLANADVSGYAKSSFTDVKNDAYYMGYIEWASKNNIVNGVGNGRFAPDQSITREQMAVIMSNYAKTIGYTLPKVHIENIFTDNAKISTYAKEDVKQMQMAGVISGKNGNLFDPQGTATRAEVSAVLRRFVELAISSDTAQGWSMNDSGKWMYFKDGKPLTGKQDIDGATYTFDQYGVTADVPKNLRYTTYTVQKGDSFWSISRKLGCPMSELERLNNKSRFSLIFPGDVLRVPEK